MAELFKKGRSTITEHLKTIFSEGELQENTVCRDFRHTAEAENRAGNRKVRNMTDWDKFLTGFLEISDYQILTDLGKISMLEAKLKRSETRINSIIEFLNKQEPPPWFCPD